MKTRSKLLILLNLCAVAFLAVYNYSRAPTWTSIGSRRSLPSTFAGGVHRPLTVDLFKKLVYLNLDYDKRLKKKSVWKWVPGGSADKAVLVDRLQVSPLEIRNGDMVTIEWRSLPKSVSEAVVLALYCPQGTNEKLIDYWPLDEEISKENMKMNLYNVRMDCQFKVHSNHSGKIVAVSDAIRFKDSLSTPEHCHLALTDNPQEMRVQWSSGYKYVPEVLVGLSLTNLPHRFTGTSSTYSAKDMCGPPANLSAHFIDPGQLHSVLLTGLKPRTKYYYQYGNKEFKFSTVKSFTTAPINGSKDVVKFIVYGDMDITPFPGSESTMKNVLNEVSTNAASFVLHIGDLSYAYGFGYRWDEWMTLIEPVASAVPYMVSVGNHEQDTLIGSEKDRSGEKGFHPSWGNYGHDSGGECGVPVFHRFHMPDNGNHVYWYSFKYGSIQMIQLSSEHDYTAGSRQHTWLSNVLERLDRQMTPWVAVTAHRPLYCTSKYMEDYETAMGMQRALEELLVSHEVDLFIGGHLHVYERTCRMYKSKCSSNRGMIHLVAGAAGFELDHGEQFEDKEWSLYFAPAFGYGRISASHDHLLWEYVSNYDGKVIDSLSLKK